MQITQILFYILMAFVAYVIGRIGHVYWGHLRTPHHWIYGLILMILGLIFYEKFSGLLMFSLGTGHFISDFKDFLHFRLLGG